MLAVIVVANSVPKLFAQYLKLDNPASFTGHALRRSSATILVGENGDLLTLNRHGGWRSYGVVEGYIEESLAAKSQISQILFSNIKAKPHTTTSSENKNKNKGLDEIETQDYYGVGGMFGLDEVEQIRYSTVFRYNANIIDNVSDQNTVNYTGIYQRKLA